MGNCGGMSSVKTSSNQTKMLPDIIQPLIPEKEDPTDVSKYFVKEAVNSYIQKESITVRQKLLDFSLQFKQKAIRRINSVESIIHKDYQSALTEARQIAPAQLEQLQQKRILQSNSGRDQADKQIQLIKKHTLERHQRAQENMLKNFNERLNCAKVFFGYDKPLPQIVKIINIQQLRSKCLCEKEQQINQEKKYIQKQLKRCGNQQNYIGYFSSILFEEQLQCLEKNSKGYFVQKLIQLASKQKCMFFLDYS